MTRYATALSRQVVSFIIVLYAIGFWRSANRLPPGPHVTYPELIIIALVGIVLVDAFMRTLQLLSSRDPISIDLDEDDSDYDGPRHLPDAPGAALAVIARLQTRTLTTLFATVLMVYAVPRIGFFEAIFLFLLLGYWFLGLRRPLSLFVTWVFSSLLIWFTFTQLLVVQRVPRGFLSPWLF